MGAGPQALDSLPERCGPDPGRFHHFFLYFLVITCRISLTSLALRLARDLVKALRLAEVTNSVATCCFIFFSAWR